MRKNIAIVMTFMLSVLCNSVDYVNYHATTFEERLSLSVNPAKFI